MSKIREIIQDYFHHNYSERVRKEFAIWHKDSKDAGDKEAAIKETWDEIDELDLRANESTERSYENLILVIQASNIFRKRRKHLFKHRLSRIAAILLLPVISVGVTYLIMKDLPASREGISLIECIVPDGEMRTVILPDSSVVKVNSGSILIYPQKFTTSRDVFLNGEAYFTVARNETKPFVVKTTDMDVKVLGTIFNISSYADSESSTATLERGKIDVRFKNRDEESVILLPNERITYCRSSGLIEKRSVKVENEIAWIEGGLIIQQMTIEEIIKVIERKYAMKVYLNSSHYEKERITMKVIHGETITEFMEVLQYLLPQLKYKITNDRLFIY